MIGGRPADELLGVALSLAAVVAPLCLAWWLLGRSLRHDSGMRRGSNARPGAAQRHH